MKKLLIFLHKWLGVVLALFFLMWFASGVVLYFVPFPNLTQTERLSALSPLDLPIGCCLTAQQAGEAAGLRFTDARLGMHGKQPAWRLLASGQDGAGAHWRTVDAHSGQVLPLLNDLAASTVAQAFSGRAAIATERLERDQWTVPQGLDSHRPLVKVVLDGDDGLELYVSPGAAEVVRDTRRSERFWNWLGAVPHWLYPTVLRQFPKAWHQVVVWVSIAGVLVALSGLVLGVWQLFLNRNRWIPYRKFWTRWHHIAGLVAAVFSVTWIVSGLLSMNPFEVFGGRAASSAERTQWQGAVAEVRLDPAAALAIARAQGLQAQELDVARVAGQAWYRLRTAEQQLLVRADVATPSPETAVALSGATVGTLLHTLRPAHGTPSVQRIDAYDDQYYARNATDANTRHARPLPVWRADWGDGVTVYADPASARILLRTDEAGRWRRLLYNGLHSFDFAPLLARPWLRHILVVGLSLLGVALCITSCVLAWRVLVPRQKRRQPAAAGAQCRPDAIA